MNTCHILLCYIPIPPSTITLPTLHSHQDQCMLLQSLPMNTCDITCLEWEQWPSFSCIAPQQKFNVTKVCTTSRELEVKYVLCSCLRNCEPPEHVTSRENESARTNIYSLLISVEQVYSLQSADGFFPCDLLHLPCIVMINNENHRRSASLAVHCHEENHRKNNDKWWRVPEYPANVMEMRPLKRKHQQN